MRPSDMRVSKYGAKASGDVAKARTDRYAAAQKSHFKASTADSVHVEHLVKSVIGAAGVMPALNHYYIDFGKKVYQITRTHIGETAKNEACIAFNKWRSRGLSETLLDEILHLFMPGTSCIAVACDYPDESEVEKGVSYAYGAMTGTLDRGLPWTGQIVSYMAGDDGAYQKGHTTDRPEPGSRFTDNGDGTVTDNATGLMWAQDGNGAGCNNGVALSWVNAITWAEGLIFAGHDDWRLPNVKELQSIADYGRVSPAIDPVFTNTQSGYYWSSTTLTVYTVNAWYVGFFDGCVNTNTKGATCYVRAVRGGKP